MKQACSGSRSPWFLHPQKHQASPGVQAWKDGLTLGLFGNATDMSNRLHDQARPCLLSTDLLTLKNKTNNCLPMFWQHNKKDYVTPCCSWNNSVLRSWSEEIPGKEGAAIQGPAHN